MKENTRSYEIHKSNLPALEKRLEVLTRKATKYGLPLPSYEIISEDVRKEVRGGRETGRVTPVLNIRITGQSPVLEGGWKLVAVVDHRIVPHEDLGWTIYSVPWAVEDGVEIPTTYHTDPPWCDHCDLSRDRLETFIIVNDAAEFKRVGRNCLTDYTSGIPLHAYAAYLYDLPNIALGLEDNLSGAGREYVDTEDYLTHVSAVIGKFGWMSRSRARENYGGLPATADEALDNLYQTEKHQIKPTEANIEEARSALEWARETLPNGDDLNEYEYNLVIAAAQQATAVNRIGLVASVIAAWNNEIARIERVDNSNSTHQGEIKERLDLTLTVTRRLDIEIQSYNGRGTDVLKVHVFTDEDGNVYVWKTTAQKLAEGDTYVGRGTVKEHTDYEGIAQTTLTRCKLVHEPCGKLEYWYDDSGNWHCVSCEEDENE